MVVMNWLGKMIGLPEEFLHRKGGNGGGVIQVNVFFIQAIIVNVIFEEKVLF